MSYHDDWTEDALAALEKRIAELYSTAMADIAKELDAFFNGTTFVNELGEAVRGKSLADRAAEFRKLVEAGERTEQEFRQWLLNQAGRGQRFEALRDKLAQRITDANQTAAAYVSDTTPGVYSLNRNYEAFTIERSAQGADFTLLPESAVRTLIRDNPATMPFYSPAKAIDRGIDLEYGRKKITDYVTSGILSGQSIPQMARNLREQITTMGYHSSVRAARTAVTAAQNGGRMATFQAARDMGIVLKKQWMATRDSRTRHSHRQMDLELADIDEPFSNGLMRPGDPSGPAREVYNCRCTMRSVVQGHNRPKELTLTDSSGKKNVIGMSFEEWEAWKDEKSNRR